MSYNKDYESCSHRKSAEDVAVQATRYSGVTAYIIGILAALMYRFLEGIVPIEQLTGESALSFCSV